MAQARIIALAQRRQRHYNATKCSEAMQEAIEQLGGHAKLVEVIRWMTRHYHFRQWKESTIRNYFYHMSKPRKFVRVVRGVYRNVGRREVAQVA